MPQKLELDPTWLARLMEFRLDPYGFVAFAFPWGESGSPLEHQAGPDEWQAMILMSVRDKLMSFEEAIRVAVASGKGIGKSCLVAWLILWAVCTRVDTRGIVTANTESQLKTKTWPEVAKWYNLSPIIATLFRFTATAIYSADKDHERTWRVDMLSWSEENVEAFAGLHNQGKRIIVIFDEASAIPDKIWDTTDGIFTDTDTEVIFCAFGNPTRTTGRFRELFGRLRHRWTTRQIDSRTVAITNKKELAKQVEDNGEDSDYVRVNIKGQFPRASASQFISGEVVDAAQTREAQAQIYDPLIIGVDVARQGDDQSVIAIRKGRDAQTIKWIKLRISDLMQLAAKVADIAQKYRADMVFIDEGGMGYGVLDRCRQLKVTCIGVNFGGKPDYPITDGEDAIKVRNKRAEMWAHMRRWLKLGAIPDDQELRDDLTNIEFYYTDDQAIFLEKKSDMKKRGLSSPDNADALALTFAYPVQPNIRAGRAGLPANSHNMVQHDYDPFDDA